MLADQQSRQGLLGSSSPVKPVLRCSPLAEQRDIDERLVQSRDLNSGNRDRDLGAARNFRRRSVELTITKVILL